MASIKDGDLELYTRDLWNTIMRIIHNFRSGSVFKEDAELSLPQTMLLFELNEAGTVSMSDLSKRLQVTQGVATRMVDRLLERGMVKRERDKADRRVVLVSLSQEGERIAVEIETVYKLKIQELFQTVSRKERDDFLNFMKDLEQQFESELERE
jgi:DNA-binding MarR family transcriptional regulator